jgi:hypothetical protein
VGVSALWLTGWTRLSDARRGRRRASWQARNGSYGHGGRPIETMALRAEVTALLRESRELLLQIE